MQEKIRKDIHEMNLIPLSVVGKCMLMGFDADTLKFGVGILQLRITKENLTAQKRWEELTRLCTDYAKSYGLAIDYDGMFRLKKELGVENDWMPFDAAIPPINLTNDNNWTEKDLTPPWDARATPEERDKFLTDNFKRAYQLEANRNPVNNVINSHWRYLLSGQKKKMFSWFPHLREVHGNDWRALRNWMDTEVVPVPPDFLVENSEQQLVIDRRNVPHKKSWSREDKDLIDWVNHNWNPDLWGRFAISVAEKLRIEIGKGPDGPTAQDRSLQVALKHIKNLIIRIPADDVELEEEAISLN